MSRGSIDELRQEGCPTLDELCSFITGRRLRPLFSRTPVILSCCVSTTPRMRQ